MLFIETHSNLFPNYPQLNQERFTRNQGSGRENVYNTYNYAANGNFIDNTPVFTNKKPFSFIGRIKEIYKSENRRSKSTPMGINNSNVRVSGRGSGIKIPFGPCDECSTPGTPREFSKFVDLKAYSSDTRARGSVFYDYESDNADTPRRYSIMVPDVYIKAKKDADQILGMAATAKRIKEQATHIKKINRDIKRQEKLWVQSYNVDEFK